MIQTILGIYTVLGGLAVVAYFWEKQKRGFVSGLRSLRRAPAIPVDGSSVSAYANGHLRARGLVQALSQRRGLEIGQIDGESVWLIEQLCILGIGTIASWRHI